MRDLRGCGGCFEFHLCHDTSAGCRHFNLRLLRVWPHGDWNVCFADLQLHCISGERVVSRYRRAFHLFLHVTYWRIFSRRGGDRHDAVLVVRLHCHGDGVAGVHFGGVGVEHHAAGSVSRRGHRGVVIVAGFKVEETCARRRVVAAE